MSNQVEDKGTFPHHAILTKPRVHRVENTTERIQQQCESLFSSHAFATIETLERGLRAFGYTLGDEPRLEYDLDTSTNVRYVKHVKAFPIDSNEGHIQIGFDRYYVGVTGADTYVLMQVTEHIREFARPVIDILGR